MLDALFEPPFGASTSVIFGGGRDTDNATSFLSKPGVDVALVGGGTQTAAGLPGVLDASYAAEALAT